MARWFRSEPMEYISLIVNEDAAHDCLAELGKMSVIQFIDLNPDLTPFQRRYVPFVRRCDALDRRLRFFAAECEKFGLDLESAGSIDQFLNAASDTTNPSDDDDDDDHDDNDNVDTGERLLEGLETELEEYESQLRELNSYNEKLTTEYNEKMELQEVLEQSRRYFMSDEASRYTASTVGMDPEQDGSIVDSESGAPTRDADIRFSSITGIITSTEKARFERMIFRATRGNCYVRFASIQHPMTDPQIRKLVDKSVFVIFFKSLSIENKLKKICDAFEARRYSLPDVEDSPAVDRMLTENAQELVDCRTILLKNQDTRFRLCQMLAKFTERWTWIVLREKAIYHSLNQFKADVSGMLRGEGWVIAESVHRVREVVNRSHANILPGLVDSAPQPWPTPPTHFITNKFTFGYQEFVNTYGIPRYRETNPALLTAATFPFLFGVMYGDIGHGLFIFFAGVYLVFNEKKNDQARLDEMTAAVHAGRYMILMMGFFAIYAGFVYNDVFSLGLDLFGSRWEFEGQHENNVDKGATATPMGGYGNDTSVYPFGLDPVWHVATNELLFFNSFKMKLSVILGVAQMLAGTCLKGMNAMYFGEKLNLYFEFIPMVAFATSLFVYMLVLIFIKWCINWNSRMLSATCIDPDSDEWGSSDFMGEWTLCDRSGNGYCTAWGYSCSGNDTIAEMCPLDYGGSGDGCQPPNLITTLINIALSPGSVDEPMYPNQNIVQILLLTIAMVSVPILLFAKPYFLTRKPSGYDPISQHDEEGGDDTADEGGEEDGFGDIMIHQAIETIEFVLGMVSNTASYLRLWALSLAHSQLASVFWDNTISMMLNTGSWFLVYTAFVVFAGATAGVLLLMDVLECFLHALRLHWVEFQNKFFQGDGIRFNPYSFQQVIKDTTA